MAKIIEEIRLILSDVGANSNKVWEGRLYDNQDCETRWGRIGDSLQSKMFPGAGKSFLLQKEKEKLKKGYEPLKVINSGPSGVKSVNIAKQNLESIAVKQIITDSPEVLNLVKYLAQVNIHSILSATTMSYDESLGTFSTPLGVVTANAILEARDLLVKISDFVADKKFTDGKYTGLLNAYLRLIPQKVGRRLDPATLYPNLDAVRKQNDVLDSLEASLKMIESGSKKKNKVKDEAEPRLFDAKLSLIEDKNILDYINKKYKSTSQSMHAASRLGVSKVYGIEIAHMVKAFNEFGSKVGNIMELWHGTKASNLLSILKNGFVVPPANSAHCTGRMFGPGTYFSDQSTKSLNYAYGYWDGTRNSKCYMLLNDVAMGKYYVPKNSYENLPKPGFDSTFAKAHMSGVINNEMIVPDVRQIQPKYLIEFA